MALFERLGAFKSWAKETGTSRAALARDKRLDEPLSVGISADHLVLQNASTIIPRYTPGVGWVPPS